MQNDHAFIWMAMLETIDVDLLDKRVLDAGCNQGGFLRLIADRCGIVEGFGYEPASSAIADARQLAGQRPLEFEADGTVPADSGVASRHVEELHLPKLYDIDEVVTAFEATGFDASVGGSRFDSYPPPATGTVVTGGCSTGWTITATRNSCSASAARLLVKARMTRTDEKGPQMPCGFSRSARTGWHEERTRC